MENVSLPDDVIASFKKFKMNYEAANDMYEELRQHIGKYVAIDDGKVMWFTETYQEAKKKYGSSDSVFIDLVTDNNIFWIL